MNHRNVVLRNFSVTSQVRLAARVTVQQVTCRTSPTGECGKLLAVPERGQASCLSRCWFSASKIFNFLKMLTREISTTCWSPSKWKSWLKTLLWLSRLCFVSGKALLQHIWTFIQEKKKRYELKRLHALRSNLRQEYFWFDSCNYLLCMFWVGQSRNTPHGQSSDDNNFKKIPQSGRGSRDARGWSSFQSKGSYL